MTRFYMFIVCAVFLAVALKAPGAQACEDRAGKYAINLQGQVQNHPATQKKLVLRGLVKAGKQAATTGRPVGGS